MFSSRILGCRHKRRLVILRYRLVTSPRIIDTVLDPLRSLSKQIEKCMREHIHSMDIEKGKRARYFKRKIQTRSFDHSILSVQGDLGPFVQKTEKRGLSPTDNQVESCTVGIFFKE